MPTRFTPSLETLGDRLSPTPWMPHTEQTRQITIIQDVSPPADEYALRAGGTDSIWTDIGAPVLTAPVSGDASSGPGVYKSVDGGGTW